MPKTIITPSPEMSNQLIYIGLDDTDNHESRGTGRLARQIANNLKADYQVLGVTRHQLLVDPRVPSTAKNSSAAICLDTGNSCDGKMLPEPETLFERVRGLMMADFQPGSDPGLCIAMQDSAQKLVSFGRRAQRELLTQEETRCLAASHSLLLEGLAGTQDGVIGAMAAVGLAASGEDGRYILVGRSRELTGLQPISLIIEAGISQVLTLEGSKVEEGQVLSDKLRPSRRYGQPVLFVAWNHDHWLPLKLD